MKKTIICLLLLSSVIAHSMRTENNSVFVRDFEFLVKKLQETHPDPYSGFGGRPAFYKEKETFKNRISEISDTTEFVKLANEFLAFIEDGHTFLNQQKNERTISTRKYLPLIIKPAVDGLYIAHTTESYKELRGGIISSINDISMEELLLKTNQLVAAENKFGSYLNLSNLLWDNEQAAQLLGPVEQLKIGILFDDDIFTSNDIRYIEKVEWSVRKDYLKSHNENQILFAKMLDKTGYIRWNSVLSRELIEGYLKEGNDPSWIINWGYSYLPDTPSGNPVEDMKKIPSLYETFATTLVQMKEKGGKDLIIDLRNNSGGMTPLIYPIIYMLYGDDYLKTNFETRYDIRISPLLLEKWNFHTLEAINSAWNATYEWGDFYFGSFGEIDSSKPIEELRPLVKSYSGIGEEWIKKGIENCPDSLQVYVLISPETFSAAYHFCFYLWKMGAITVGVPPRQAGNTFMETTHIKLPETGVTGSISNAIQVFFPDDPKMGKIMMPDIPMYVNDFIRYEFDLDAEVMKVLEMID